MAVGPALIRKWHGPARGPRGSDGRCRLAALFLDRQDPGRSGAGYRSHRALLRVSLKKKNVLLVGYSQGADVLPFAVNRLPPATRALIRQTTLIGISESAAFEFHVANWIGSDSDGLAVKPEIDRLSSADTLCVYGDDDDESICPKVNAQHVRVIKLPGGHHFGGNYVPLAQLVIGASAQPH